MNKNMYNDKMELTELSSMVVSYELNQLGFSEKIEYPSWFQADLEIPEQTEDEIQADLEIMEMSQDMEMEMEREIYD